MRTASVMVAALVAVMLWMPSPRLCAEPIVKVTDHYRPGPEQRLREAAAAGDLNLIRKLAGSGTNMNGRDYDGWTPLTWATMADEPESVRLLLEKGADSNVADRLGRTALYWASMDGNTEIMSLLLEHGASVEAREKKRGWTPLMRAASKGKTDAVDLLLSKGADPDTKDRKGKTALALAALEERRGTAGVLLSRGAKLDERAGRILAAAGTGSIGQTFQQAALLTYAIPPVGPGTASLPHTATTAVACSDETPRVTTGGPLRSSSIQGGATRNRNYEIRPTSPAIPSDPIRTGIGASLQATAAPGGVPKSPERADQMLTQAVVLWRQILREYPEMAARLLQESARRLETVP